MSPLLNKNECIVSIFSCGRARLLPENTRICDVPVWLVCLVKQAAEKPWKQGWVDIYVKLSDTLLDHIISNFVPNVPFSPQATFNVFFKQRISAKLRANVVVV